MPTKRKVPEPKKVKASSIDPKKRESEAPDVLFDPADPRHQWERPLQAPGRMAVDFEERVDFRRLHDYRLARTRNALAGSGLGALAFIGHGSLPFYLLEAPSCVAIQSAVWSR